MKGKGVISDKDNDIFRSICKVGTGFTDENLSNFHSILKQYIIPQKYANVDSKLEADVWFEPYTIIEIIASEITLSPLHMCGMNSVRQGSGLALRFPKFTGKIRNEKNIKDATTVQEIINLYKKQSKVIKENTMISKER